MGEKLESILTRIFRVVCAAVFVVLWISCFAWTGKNGSSEYIYFTKDNPLINLLGLAAALGVIFCLGKAGGYVREQRRMDLLAFLVSLTCMALAVYWVWASNTGVRADQAQLVENAVSFSKGDFHSLERGGYMAKCQHQLGMVTLIRALFALFGTQDYRIVQYFNAVMAALLIYSGYQLAKRLSQENAKAEIVYLFMAMTCFPIYGFVPYVYGEISSTALIMLAAWMLYDCLQNMVWWKWLILLGSVGLAFQLRRNTAVMIIGFAVVLCIRLLAEPSLRLGVTLAGVLLGLLLSQLGIRALYGRYIAEDAKSIPAALYIAMGTHDTYADAPGWFDGTNHIRYDECGHDYDMAKEAAERDIRAFAERCAAEPQYAVRFYSLKWNTQWNAPMYQCLAVTNEIVGEQRFPAGNLYFTRMGQAMVLLLNIHQLIVYGGVLCFLVLNGGRKREIAPYVLLVGIFGGFLFSLLWEAATRYVFPYMVFMIPYAAVGVIQWGSNLRAGVINWKKGK